MPAWRDVNILAEVVEAYYRTGDAHVVVRRGTTDAASGTNLLAAYTAAKTLTPGGAALSASNRAVVALPPGGYDLATGLLTLDTDFVDLVALCPDLGRPNDWADYDSSDESVNGASDNYYPPSTLIYGTAVRNRGAGTGNYAVVNQTCNDLRLHGFGIANRSLNTLIDSGGTPGGVGYYYSSYEDAFALRIACASGDNARSVYSDLWLYCHEPACGVNPVTTPQRSPCASICDFKGTWRRAYANAYGFRLAATSKTMAPDMEDCIGGCRSYGGDLDSGTLSGRYVNCWARGASKETSTYGSGYGAFGGCVSYGIDIDSNAVFVGGGAGNQSYGLGATCAGTFKGVQVFAVTAGGYPADDAPGQYCFGATMHNSHLGAFTGYAEGICAKDSFGGGDSSLYLTSYPSAQGDCQGALVSCELLGNVAPLNLTGASLRRCTVQVADNAYAGRNAHSSSDNTTIVIADLKVAKEFPIGSWVYHTAQTEWVRVTAAVINGANTEITTEAISGADEWDDETGLKGYPSPLVLQDGNSKIIDCTVLVGDSATGGGIPIDDDGSARNVVSVHNRMNNYTNDADGLGANVTNLIDQTACGDVIDDHMAL